MKEILPSDKIFEEGGEQYVTREGKRYRVMWKDTFPPEPVLVEVS